MSVTSTVQVEPTQAWTRLQDSPEWANLTPSQRIFVVQFLASASALSATKTAYKSKSDDGARRLSYEMAKNPTIVAAIDVAVGKVKAESEERDDLIKTVRAQLKAAEKGSIAASKFAAQLERLLLGNKSKADKPETESSGVCTEHKFSIGQLVTERDDEGVVHTGRILEVGEDGAPTRIEEVK